MKRLNHLWGIPILLFFTGTFNLAADHPPKPVVIEARKADMIDGGLFEIKLAVVIADPWHVFSQHPEVPGIKPFALQIEKSDSYTVQEIVFPDPSPVYSAIFGKIISFHQGETIILVRVRFNEETPRQMKLNGTLIYQACSDRICLPPGQQQFSVVQNMA